ncbi:aldehyde dehydrogenase family protein [Bacillus benzoevorans]|uniref:Acyl-CoA reductase-like NAD-dependent aldehyde dehydrogenase n=1 Tax=Bacillus benzoevorans TaxID=1456 RepID=A0A7X0HPG6_9BACI|nr:aldehyde dehydrogenase family protein [Bacillus benzoevorans]MBB6444514.1 acyl-CoA reductase-like NAD-dependent aldehyde dehydrogenase [Bacillus benzoevorans]
MKVNLFINNEDVTTEHYDEVKDPGRLSETAGYIAKGDASHIDQAVQAAQQAFLSWRQTSLEERMSILLESAEEIEKNASSIASVTAKENGILLSRTVDEVKAGLMEMRNMIELAPSAFQQQIIEDESGWVSVVKRPMGVIACIVPWNAPIILTLQKITPILLAGNTIVVKPSPTASMGVVAILRMMAGSFPPGVINVVLGGGDVGSALTSHPLVRKISFTGGGSTAVAIMKSAAETLKGVHFELGGNDPAIVLDDADLNEVVPKIVEGAFRRTGQFCFAIKRVYIPYDMYDEFYEKACELTDAYKIGHQLNKAATMGPINNQLQYVRISELIKRLEDSGVNLVKLGKRLEPENWENGYYLQPVIVRDVDPNAEIVTCEQFGPVLPLIPYHTEEEVIRMANNTEFGLGSSIWSSDFDRALGVANQIEAGMTFINGHGQTSLGSKHIPFGGVKQSGIGREKSIEVFNEFIEYHGINYHKKQS